jgi:hypothetical protein
MERGESACGVIFFGSTYVEPIEGRRVFVANLLLLHEFESRIGCGTNSLRIYKVQLQI